MGLKSHFLLANMFYIPFTSVPGFNCCPGRNNIRIMHAFGYRKGKATKDMDSKKAKGKRLYTFWSTDSTPAGKKNNKGFDSIEHLRFCGHCFSWYCWYFISMKGLHSQCNDPVWVSNGYTWSLTPQSTLVGAEHSIIVPLTKWMQMSPSWEI